MNKKLLALIIVIAIGTGAAAVWLFQANLQATSVAASERAQSGDREMVIAVEEVVNGERTAGTVRVTFEDPDTLPDRPTDASGLFVSGDATSLTLGTGTIEVEVGIDVINDDEPVTTIDASFSGPEETVQFNDSTQFYADTTARPNITTQDVEAGTLTVTRMLEPGSADAIGENMMIRIWGHQENGRLVADVVVYEPIR